MCKKNNMCICLIEYITELLGVYFLSFGGSLFGTRVMS